MRVSKDGTFEENSLKKKEKMMMMKDHEKRKLTNNDNNKMNSKSKSKNLTSIDKKSQQQEQQQQQQRQQLVEEELASDSGDSDYQGFVDTGTDNGFDSDQVREDQSEITESHLGVEESDSSEDEVAPRNTIGEVPLEWYRDEKHIGYDITGKKITKKDRQDKLDSYLASVDDSKNWRKIYDDYEDEEVELTKEEARIVGRFLKGKAPHGDFDPHAPYVDWFKWDDAKHPLSNAPEPKRRFIPSKWESKKVVKYVRAIRKGLITFDKPKEEPRFYHLWGDDSSSTEKTKHLSYIPAPKPKLPGHEESYNPSLEYIPTQEEINSYQLMYEEDRPKFVPKRFTSLRSVPGYENAVKESFERCLDLYLCPRVRKKRINIDPESLKPKLPSRKDLKPYPKTCYLEYRGHTGAVMSISTSTSGQWIASGSSDGTVRIWEVETGRCLRVWEIGEAVQYVAWNPLPELPILAVTAGQDVLVLNTGLGNEEEQENIKELLRVETPTSPDDNDNMASVLRWIHNDKHEGIKLRHFKSVSSVEWHRKGDYFSTVMPAGQSRAILMHQLSKKLTQIIPFKLQGLPVASAFHPTRSIFFISTKKNVRVYDLLKQKMIKKLETGLREASSISIHPTGDNLIVGSKEGKLCWFDMDLSSKPYRALKCHPKDITSVAFHRSYPLFASSSDDGTAYVFHGMVYSDLTQNPLIVPLEILRGHTSSNGRGVMDCKFHPRQPWLFTAGADSLIKLYCH
ncbi:WD40 domain-containing protein/BOP1NT domain-containing protein [Cephalotus follicularis]|uniref:Ribosome biogenesis protein BOP1 homolog n=1 Tax=Cephalotus follicularis TaxID=3775 RepID=A0A1Q3D1Z9_CEPFO|nr:WD40 domain-containing protein/BOP1NT domain-containing protein [Cephalotus follicularis]